MSGNTMGFRVLDDKDREFPNMRIAYQVGVGYYFYDTTTGKTMTSITQIPGDATKTWVIMPVVPPNGLSDPNPYGRMMYVNNTLNLVSFSPPTEKVLASTAERMNVVRPESARVRPRAMIENVASCATRPPAGSDMALNPDVCPGVDKTPGGRHFCMAICDGRDGGCRNTHEGPWRRLASETMPPIEVDTSPSLWNRIIHRGYSNKILERVKAAGGKLYLCDEHYKIVQENAGKISKTGYGLGASAVMLLGMFGWQTGALGALWSAGTTIGSGAIGLAGMAASRVFGRSSSTDTISTPITETQKIICRTAAPGSNEYVRNQCDKVNDMI